MAWIVFDFLGTFLLICKMCVICGDVLGVLSLWFVQSGSKCVSEVLAINYAANNFENVSVVL